MSEQKERIGFIGLGAMGVGMAANIISSGYPLSVMGNRRREPVERLIKLGANEVGTAAELAAVSDIVIICVTTSEVVEQLVLGEEGLLAGMTQPFLLIDCGTSNPNSTLRLGQALAEKGCSMMDVPLGRSAAAAESGTLNMMAAGSPEDFTRAKPLLETMSENLFHVGDLGVGHKLKLINNAYSMSVACLVAESIHAAKQSGVDVKLLNEVMAAGPNRSDFFDWMMHGVLTGDESKLQFSLANGCKDVGYFNDMVRAVGVEAKIPEHAHKMLEKVVSDGHGEETVPAIARLWAK